MARQAEASTSAANFVAYRVGRPFDPEQCTPGLEQPPAPGTLAVALLGPVGSNGLSGLLPDGLEVTLDAPATVRAGDIPKYDVAFTAAVDQVLIGADSCPIYNETLSVATGQFLLECNGTDGVLIHAGESVVFHIELPIPADTTLGPATLRWTPIEPSGTAVTAAVTIVG